MKHKKVDYNAVVIRIEESSEYPSSYFAICESTFGEIRIFVSPKVLQYNKVDKINVGDKLLVIKSYNQYNKKMWVVKDVQK